ncbi:MAG: hypothetical protein E7273_10805 [Pseudobutyrivibrio ruminis]|nr:hypothetical protein [Pseudobutyrivibrio ruminis]
MFEVNADLKEDSRIVLKISISIFICILTATVLNILNLKISYHDMQLDIIQKATAAISCLLVTQDNLGSSIKAGKTRIRVTMIAAIVALVVISVDSWLGNQWFSIVSLIVGVILTMLLCKLLKVPFMSCRIGAISFVLIAVTLPGQSRLIYALFRVISTIFGVVVVSLVSTVYDHFFNTQLVNQC